MAIIASGVKRIGIPSHKEGVDPHRRRDVGVVATGGVVAMTCGDAMASVVGRRRGRRGYSFWGHRRTWEGSITMFVVSLVAILVTLLALPGSSLNPTAEPIPTGTALMSAFVAAVVATLAQAAAPAGTDNLSVPLLTAAALYLVVAI